MMSLVLDKPTKPRVKRWTKREYNDLVDKGAFHGQQLFLLRGSLIEMPQMGTAHALCLTKLTDWAVSTFGPEYQVRMRMPFETPGESMPDPDVAIIPDEFSLRIPHPNVALLVVEVSDISIDLDRDKALEYAAAGVPEYWIVDVNARQVEVYRQPVKDSTTALGYRYSLQQIAAVGSSIAPLDKPAALIAVGDMLA
jgi:Uma2 family endonuclease